ncbi:sensory neuron membrane protein 2-like [Thrips palmi]|uniref:Sensory neuron membrane protein 2-like n=1 Tax=Thrips palmi TaxID=161013 RepID=A0A6P8ZWB4_THRPL|nr:sensory neuron membrane protein 2-like [Thrips palmi]
MQDSNAAWVVAAGVILTAMGLVGNFYAVPSLVQSMVMEKVALKEGSEALERFRKTPQPLHFHVYLFHVENPEEVSGQGARPVLTEKGPYIYDMYRERVELEFHDQDDTVSYLPKSSYYFNKDKSGCRSESDTVTVIHAPILGTALKLQQVSAMGLGIFNDAVPLLFTAKNIFLTTTVGELLFSGVFINCSFPEDSFPAGAVCQGLRQRAPATYRRDGLNFYFSMFGHLNGTSHERIRVHRGQDDARAVGVITAVAGNATLATWRQGTPCNLINGTDGTLFGPFQRGATVLPIYTSASCRSLYLHYKEDTDLNGVPVMRFAIDTDMLASGLEYAPNRCFCVIAPEEDQQADPDEEEAARRRRRAAGMTVEEKEAKSCLPNGTMSLAPCSGSPVILSFPHFYLGDKALVDYPVGLAPREEAHQTIVDIEPTTGIPLRAKKRVQLNMFLKKIEDFNYLASVSEGLFPILWMEEVSETRVVDVGRQ